METFEAPKTEEQAIEWLKTLVAPDAYADVEYLYRIRRGWGNSVADAYERMVADLYMAGRLILDKEQEVCYDNGMFPFTVIITRKSDGKMMLAYDVDAPSQMSAKDGVWQVFRGMMLQRGKDVKRSDYDVTAAPHGM